MKNIKGMWFFGRSDLLHLLISVCDFDSINLLIQYPKRFEKICSLIHLATISFIVECDWHLCWTQEINNCWSEDSCRVCLFRRSNQWNVPTNEKFTAKIDSHKWFFHNRKATSYTNTVVFFSLHWDFNCSSPFFVLQMHPQTTFASWKPRSGF